MIQTALGDVRPDAELGEAGTYRSSKVVQRERAHLVLGKRLEVPRDASRQEPRIHGPVTGFCGEYPRVSAGRSLQVPELFRGRPGQRYGKGDIGLGSPGGDFPGLRLGLKVQLGPSGSSKFRSPDSGQEDQPDCDTCALRSLGDLIDIGEEGVELLVIEGTLSRPFGASRTGELSGRGCRADAGAARKARSTSNTRSAIGYPSATQIQTMIVSVDGVLSQPVSPPITRTSRKTKAIARLRVIHCR